LSAKPEETKAKTARRTEENFILDLSQQGFEEKPVDDKTRGKRELISPCHEYCGKKQIFYIPICLEKLAPHVPGGNVD
jgi:hypothetical protein